MRKKFYFLFGLILIPTISSLWALNAQHHPFFYQIGFQQNLNSYQWLSQIKYKRMILGPGWLEINEDFNSSLIQLSQADQKWKDDQRLNLNLFLPYSPRWGLRFSASANNFSDRLSGLVSDIKTNWATIGSQLQPLPKVELSSAVGYKYDDRLAKIDRGITYDIRLNTDLINIKDYDNQFHLLNRADRYSIRKNNDFELQYQVKRHFQGASVDSLSLYWSKKRRDNYDQIAWDQLFIESLAEENRGLQHYLVYGATTGFEFTIRTQVNSRQTRVGKYDEKTLVEARSKQDFHSENEVGIIFQQPYMVLNFALRYETDNQKNEVPDSLKSKRFSKFFYYISPDYQSSRLTLSAVPKFYFLKSDTLQFNGAISIYRYNTPQNNMDDRDEFRANISVSEVHYFNPCLKLISNAGVNLYHLVYIFGERSANNSWMRIFRLFPRIIYRPGFRLSIEQQLEVLANYVDYDFDAGISATDLRSYVFRRFSLIQQVNAQLTFRTGIFLNYNVELEENGKLHWDRWTEFLLTSRETHWLRFNINYLIRDRMIIVPGILFLKRIEKQQNNLSSTYGAGGQEGNIISFGPTLKFTYQLHQKMKFSFEGMRRAVIAHSLPRKFINHFDFNLTWYN